MDLGLNVAARNGYAVLAVQGELDLTTAPQLRERLIDLVGQGHQRIVVDLEDATFLDSTGLGVLVGGLKRLRSRNGDLTLVCTQRHLLNVLKVTGLMKVFSLYASVGSAVAHDRPPLMRPVDLDEGTGQTRQAGGTNGVPPDTRKPRASQSDVGRRPRGDGDE